MAASRSMGAVGTNDAGSTWSSAAARRMRLAVNWGVPRNSPTVPRTLTTLPSSAAVSGPA